MSSIPTSLLVVLVLIPTGVAAYAALRLFGIKAAGIVGAVGAVLALLLKVRADGAADAVKHIEKKEKRDAEQSAERADRARDDVERDIAGGKLREPDEFNR